MGFCSMAYDLNGAEQKGQQPCGGGSHWEAVKGKNMRRLYEWDQKWTQTCYVIFVFLRQRFAFSLAETARGTRWFLPFPPRSY